MKRVLNIINRLYNAIIAICVSQIALKKELRAIIKKSHKNNKCLHLKEWHTKWKVLGLTNKDYYRVFSQYCGEDTNIVPDDICHNVIEPILNPKRHISTYEDKCMFDTILWPIFKRNITPDTYIKNIGGACYDSSFSAIHDVDSCIRTIPLSVNRLVIKRSIDSSSGKNIAFVERTNTGNFIDLNTNELFDGNYLNKYFSRNYIVQKAMSQSLFMSQFCKTAVNTIRIAVYKSVKTNEPHIINSIIRMGKEGSQVDNAHAGGVFIGVDKNGVLGSYCCNQYGEKYSEFNGIDFSSNQFTIPNFDEIKSMALAVSHAIPHHRLLALDIMLDENNQPILLEYNIRAFSVWLFQFTSSTGFGDYTDEIIEYCKEHRLEATRIFVSF